MNGKVLTVGDLATARSGDKGNHANIAVVAHDQASFAQLSERLTADRVHRWCRDWGCTHVVRYDLPNLLAFNFVLENVLSGGASRSLRIDTQGKLLGTGILAMKLE